MAERYCGCTACVNRFSLDVKYHKKWLAVIANSPKTALYKYRCCEMCSCTACNIAVRNDSTQRFVNEELAEIPPLLCAKSCQYLAFDAAHMSFVCLPVPCDACRALGSVTK